MLGTGLCQCLQPGEAAPRPTSSLWPVEGVGNQALEISFQGWMTEMDVWCARSSSLWGRLHICCDVSPGSVMIVKQGFSPMACLEWSFVMQAFELSGKVPLTEEAQPLCYNQHTTLA